MSDATPSPVAARRMKLRGRRPVTPLITKKVDSEDQVPPASHFEQDFVLAGGERVQVKWDELTKLEQLGRGAYGIVELMLHQPTNTKMAVKRLPYTGNAEERKRLLMDLDVNRKTGDFPYTVKFYGAFFQGGDVWLCMEPMDTSLDKFYKMVYENGEKIPEEVLGKIAVAMIKALHFLKSELNVMHRDVKPSNILVSRNGQVKMCDYGISAKLKDSLASSHVGCRPYMSPERIVDSKPYGTRSDIWSVGITMMELAIGKFPYDTDKWNSVFSQIKQVVDNEPPKLPQDDRFSTDFHDFISTCLQKDYELRPRYDELLKHPFLVKYEEQEVDMATYVSTVLDKYGKVSSSAS